MKAPWVAGQAAKVPWTDGLGEALLIFAAGLLIALGFLFL